MRGQPHDTPEQLPNSWGGVTVAEIVTDYSQNPVEATEGALDVALTGPGFIKVKNGGRQYLTRDGRFLIENDGTLATTGGAKVLNQEGVPIQVDPSAGRVTIADDGTVNQDSDQGLSAVDKIGLVQPRDYQKLQKVGENLYRNHGGEIPAGPELTLMQGYLETSGVDAVTEMVDLIETSREFEANLNMIKFQDEALGNLLSTVPRL